MAILMLNILVMTTFLFIESCQAFPTQQKQFTNRVPDCPLDNSMKSRRIGKRVVGGSPAYYGKWPWMTALMFNNSQYCGGSIVNERWIVTAAHCFHATHNSLLPNDWEAKVGKFNLSMSEPHEQTRKIKRIIQHPNYVAKWDTYQLDEPDTDDIAMVELATPLQFNEYVQPATLLTKDVKFPSGYLCTVSGWGHTSYQGSPPDRLHDVDVRLVSMAQCNSPQSYNNTVSNSSFCAGFKEGGRDSCQYDSGGPLVCCAGLGRWYLYGAVSWGQKCAEPHKYGVYTSMEKLTPWVKKIVKTNSCNND